MFDWQKTASGCSCLSVAVLCDQGSGRCYPECAGKVRFTTFVGINPLSIRTSPTAVRAQTISEASEYFCNVVQFFFYCVDISQSQSICRRLHFPETPFKCSYFTLMWILWKRIKGKLFVKLQYLCLINTQVLFLIVRRCVAQPQYRW